MSVQNARSHEISSTYWSRLTNHFTAALPSFNPIQKTWQKVQTSFTEATKYSSYAAAPKAPSTSSFRQSNELVPAKLPTTKMDKQPLFALRIFAALAGAVLIVRGVDGGKSNIATFQPNKLSIPNQNDPSLSQLFPQPIFQMHNLTVQEEVPFAFNGVITDLFGTGPQGGPLTVTARQKNGDPLPDGIQVVTQRMNIVGSIAMQGLSVLAEVNGKVYAGPSGAIFDISDVTNPQWIYSLNFPDYVSDLVCQTNRCFAQFKTGLQEMDIATDPNNPPLSPIDPLIPGSRLAIQGNIGLVLNGRNVTVIDITGKAKLISSFDAIPNSRALAYSGTTACFTNGVNGLISADVSDLSSLRFSPSIPFSVSTTGFDVLKKDNFCYVLTQNQGVQVFDVTNPIGPIMTLTLASNEINAIQSMAIVGDYLFLNGLNTIVELDISDQRNPVLITRSGVPFTFINGFNKQAVPYGNYMVMRDSSLGLKIVNRGDSVALQANAAGGTKGNYAIEFIAKDAYNNTLAPIDYSLQIDPAVTVIGIMPDQKQLIDQDWSFFIPSNVIKKFADKSLTYNAVLISNGVSVSLPIKGFTLNEQSGTFNYKASSLVLGRHDIVVTVKDSAGATNLINFNLEIMAGPKQLKTLPILYAQQGIPFEYSFADLFGDADGETLSIQITSNKNPVPAWMKIDYTNKKIGGIAKADDLGNIPLEFALTTPSDFSISASTVLQAVTAGSPILQIPVPNQTAFVGEKISLKIPKNSYTLPYGGELTYSMLSLPSSLKFDAVSEPDFMLLEGTFSKSDQAPLSNAIYDLTLVATSADEDVNGDKVHNSYNFSITLNGDSTLKYWLKIASYAISAFAAYKLRYIKWNVFNKKDYVALTPKIVFEGSEFSLDIKQSVGQLDDYRFLMKRIEKRVLCGFKIDLDCLVPNWIPINPIAGPYKDRPAKEKLPAGFIYLQKENKIRCVNVVNMGEYSTMLFQEFDNAGRIMQQQEIQFVATQDVDVEAGIKSETRKDESKTSQEDEPKLTPTKKSKGSPKRPSREDSPINPAAGNFVSPLLDDDSLVSDGELILNPAHIEMKVLNAKTGAVNS